MKFLEADAYESSTRGTLATLMIPFLLMTGNFTSLNLKSSKAVSAKALSEIGNSYQDFDVIGIDEGQFFPDVRIFTN